jgi:hypothetical protein
MPEVKSNALSGGGCGCGATPPPLTGGKKKAKKAVKKPVAKKGKGKGKKK